MRPIVSATLLAVLVAISGKGASDGALLRDQSVRLRRAVLRCRQRLATHDLDICTVTLPWEGDREISLSDAEALAVRLGRAALGSALSQMVSEDCNFFLADVGNALDIPYFRSRVDDSRIADQMYTFILNATKSRGSGWRRVESYEVQSLANDGYFVVGVAHSIVAGTPGHVVIAVPDDFRRDPANNGVSGPFVRDGQHPFASWKASGRFGSSVTQPIWAVWRGDTQ